MEFLADTAPLMLDCRCKDLRLTLELTPPSTLIWIPARNGTGIQGPPLGISSFNQPHFSQKITMRKILPILLLAALVDTCFGQLPPYIRSPFNTNSPALVTNIVRSLTGGGATNGIQMLNGTGTNTTLVDPAFPGGINASNLTGTIPDEVFPDVLPAVDGSQLTGIGGMNYAFVTNNSTWRSAKDWGAVGNGVADDTAALNAAFRGSWSNRLYIPPGTYSLTGPLWITNQINLSGGGMKQSVLKWSSAGGGIILSNVSSGDAGKLHNVQVSNLRIEGPSSFASGAGIVLDGTFNANSEVSGTLIQSVDISRFQTGLVANTIGSAVFDKLHIRENLVGVFLSTQINGCTFIRPSIAFNYDRDFHLKGGASGVVVLNCDSGPHAATNRWGSWIIEGGGITFVGGNFEIHQDKQFVDRMFFITNAVQATEFIGSAFKAVGAPSTVVPIVVDGAPLGLHGVYFGVHQFATNSVYFVANAATRGSATRITVNGANYIPISLCSYSTNLTCTRQVMSSGLPVDFSSAETTTTSPTVDGVARHGRLFWNASGQIDGLPVYFRTLDQAGSANTITLWDDLLDWAHVKAWKTLELTNRYSAAQFTVQPNRNLFIDTRSLQGAPALQITQQWSSATTQFLGMVVDAGGSAGAIEADTNSASILVRSNAVPVFSVAHSGDVTLRDVYSRSLFGVLNASDENTNSGPIFSQKGFERARFGQDGKFASHNGFVGDGSGITNLPTVWTDLEVAYLSVTGAITNGDGGRVLFSDRADNGSNLTNIPLSAIADWPANADGYLKNDGSGNYSYATPSGSVDTNAAFESVTVTGGGTNSIGATVFTGIIHGDLSGASNAPAGSLTGTIADARLSANVVLASDVVGSGISITAYSEDGETGIAFVGEGGSTNAYIPYNDGSWTRFPNGIYSTAFIGDGAGITNIPQRNITRTNDVTMTTTIALAYPFASQLLTMTDNVSVTGYTWGADTNTTFGTVTVKNTSGETKTLTLPENTHTVGGSRTLYVTNFIQLNVKHDGLSTSAWHSATW